MNGQLGKLAATLRKDPKKLFLMVVVFAALLLWGQLLLKKIPRSAIAVPDASVSDSSGIPEPGLGLFGVRSTVFVEAPTGIARDLFALDEAYYEKVETPEPKLVPKPTPEIPDEPKPEDDVAIALQNLELHGTIGGDAPRAVINGQIVGMGEEIEGFELRKVMNRHVILRKNGVHVRLEM